MSGPTHSGRPIAEARLTSLGLYVTAKEAYSICLLYTSDAADDTQFV